MDPESRDHTELLQGIWREIKVVHQSLGRRIDQTNARLDQNTSRLDRIDETVAHLGERLDENTARLDRNTARLDSVEATLHVVVNQQANLNRYVRAVVDRHDSATELLDERVSRLEADRPHRPAP